MMMLLWFLAHAPSCGFDVTVVTFIIVNVVIAAIAAADTAAAAAAATIFSVCQWCSHLLMFFSE